MSVGAKIIIYSVLYFIIFGCSETANDNSDGQKNYNPFTADMVPKVKPQELKKLNNLKNYIFLKPGEFWMGSPETEIGRKKDEIKHLVQITKPFWMSKFELTNEEWNKNIPLSLQKGSPIYKLAVEDFKKICIEGNFIEGNYTIRGYEQTSRNKSSTSSFYFEEVEPNIGTMGNWERKEKKGKSFLINDKVLPSYYKILDFLKKNNILQVGLVGQKNPVTRVSHSQATAFCWRRTNLAHKQGRLPKGLIYRLPTEAEWEYACRAGTNGICGLGSGERLSGVNASLNGSRPEYVLGGKAMLINRKKVVPINYRNPKFRPNAWGIHDMHGNVMEWCHDFYSPYSNKSKSIDPLGPFNGTRRVVRGGSFYRTAHQCRSASRLSYEPSYRGSEIGFRMVIGYPLL